MEAVAGWGLPGAAHSNLLVAAALRRTGEKPVAAGQPPGSSPIMLGQPVNR
jgi:hypothetical protein